MTAATLEKPKTLPTADQLIEKIEAIVPDLQTLCLDEEKAGRLSSRTIENTGQYWCLRHEHSTRIRRLGDEHAGTTAGVYRAVAKIAGSTGWVSWVTTTHVRWITMFSEQARDEVYGMDWRAPRVSGVIGPTGPGKARAVDGGYMLQGRWPFCSGCRHTAWSILGGPL